MFGTSEREYRDCGRDKIGIVTHVMMHQVLYVMCKNWVTCTLSPVVSIISIVIVVHVQIGQHSPGGITRTPPTQSGRRHDTAAQFTGMDMKHNIVCTFREYRDCGRDKIGIVTHVMMHQVLYVMCKNWVTCTLSPMVSIISIVIVVHVQIGQHSPGGTTRTPPTQSGRRHDTAAQFTGMDMKHNIVCTFTCKCPVQLCITKQKACMYLV